MLLQHNPHILLLGLALHYYMIFNFFSIFLLKILLLNIILLLLLLAMDNDEIE